MEYKNSSGDVWSNAGNGVSFLTSGTYYVRYKATAAQFVSYGAVVTIGSMSPEETPVAAIDFANEKLTGLVANAQYKINDTGLVTANDAGNADILDSWLDTTVSIVKAGNGTTKTDSAPQLLPIPGRPAAPANIGKTDETYPGAYNGTITNVNDTMEYKNSSGDLWSNAGNGVSFLTSGTYYVRYKATAAQFVSYGAVVTIGSMSPEETPVAAIDFANEKLTGLVANAQYKINDTGLVTANDAGNADILDSWLDTTVSIVKAGNGTTKTDSAPQLLPIPGRPAAPADIGKTDETYNGAHNGTITNVNGTMEYKKGPAGAWTDTGGTSVTGLAPDTYYVRYKATSAQFVSDPATLTILASGKTQEYMPSAIISFVDEHLIGLLPNSAYKINGTTVTADTYGHIAVSGSWIGETLSVVKTGNDTTTIDSAAQSLMLPGRPAVPANVGKTDESFPAAHDGTITNVTTSMEYKRGLDGTWMAIGSTTITGLAPDIYYVRIKATFEAFASEATSVTVGSTDAVPAITPAAGISYTYEKITGLEPNAAYKINQTSVITDGSGQISISSNWIGATLSLVKTGNGQDTTDSEAQLLTIPGRPMAPAGIGQTDESFPGAHDGTITNTTAAMEYKKGIAGEWTAAGGTTVTGLAPDTYYIRTKATVTALASEETQVTVSSTTPNPQVPAGGLTVTAADPSGAADDGKTQITVAPAAAAPGHKLVYIIFGSGGVTIPNEGDMAAGYHDLPANGLISAVNGSKIGIAVIDAEGKIVSFGWTTSIVAAEPVPDSGSDDPVDSSSAAPNTGNPSTPAADDVIVLVNGKVENAGKARITEAEGVKTTAIIVDPAKLQAKLDAEGQGAIVTIPVSLASNVIVGELNGQMVKNMENTSSTLVLQTEKASYTLPAGEINIDAVSASLGGSVKLQDIIVRITIAETDSRMAQIVATAAAEGEFKVMLPSVDFTVTGEYNGKTVEITTFNTYVERSVALPDNIDPSKITTGVVVEADGTVRHVPTKVEIKDGKYYALINSLTNSTYSVVWHPLAFADVDNHWAKAAVNDMGSRMVVNGVNDTSFNPDQAITRAEFAAIIVRGLGLRLGEGKNPFSDVAAQEWYTGAVQTAASYGLIAGYEDGTFRPNATITREEAFTMTARAMKITGLEKKTGLADPSALLAEFTDGTGISDWAKTSIALTAKAGLVSGRDGSRLEAQASVTRAEVATLIQRLLMKSKLI